MLATPVSPLPTLLSLEEAQARTKSNIKTEQLSVPHKQNSSTNVSNDTQRDLSILNSPRRSRKWFGLFHNNPKKSHVSEEDVTNSKVVYYTKKQSPHLSGEPTRSQSEYRLQDLQKRHELEKDNIVRAENYQIPANTPTTDKDISSPFKSSLNSVNAPFATPELDLDINLSSDNEADSLMSAIVSVRAKYINVEDALIYHTPRRSFTIGSAAEFRKLNDSELTIEPPPHSAAEGNNNDMNTSEKNTPDDDVIQTVSCGNHRRGAPSIDSGYISQGSTLTRTPNFELSDNGSTTVGSPLERKQLRSSIDRRHTEPEEPGVPFKRIRSLSPEHCKKAAATLPKSSSETSANTTPTKVMTRKFSRSEFYKNKSSPDSRVKSFSDVISQESDSVQLTNGNNRNNSIDKEQKRADIVTTSEPMVTSPTFGKPTGCLTSGKILRPTTLLLNKNHTNELIKTPTPTSPISFQCDNVSEPINDINQQQQRHSIKGNSQSVVDTRPPLSRRSLSSSATEISATVELDQIYSHNISGSGLPNSSNIKKSNNGHPSPMTTTSSPMSPADTLLDSPRSNVVETVQWRYVNTNPLPFSSAPTTPSSPQGPTPGSAKTIVDKMQTRSSRDLTKIENRRRDLDNKSKRASVREKVREINRINSNDSSSCTTNGRPNSNPVMSWSIDKAVNNDKRNERTKSSPNLYTSRTEHTPSSMVRAHETPHQYKTATSMTISPRTGTKPQSYSESKLASPSYKDFDLRCRVNDARQVNEQKQCLRNPPTSFPTAKDDEKRPITKNSSGNKLKSRSTERFVTARDRSSSTSKHYPRGRPQSEIIRTLNFKSIDTIGSQSNHQHQQPIRSSQSVHSVNTNHRKTDDVDNYHARSLRSNVHRLYASKSETNFSQHNNKDAAYDEGRQIGNFPLTLKCGSASSSTNFELEKLKKTRRPVSLYDNESRTSYYDNVNNIRYEML